MAGGPAVSPGRPLVIAHRGASGYLPEHTLPAKALAHGMGADYLEQDVVATRDGHLIVFHDLYLDDMTDVARRFPGRARPDGRHYCMDFSLAEIRRLRVGERRRPGAAEAVFPARFPLDGGEFAVPTLEEELRFIQGLNRSTGRSAGIYAEIKDPDWHRAHGIDLGVALVETLHRFGYRQSSDPAFVQCFDGPELRRLRREPGTQLRLVQLLEGQGPVPDAGALASIASYAQAIGPGLRLLGEQGAGDRASSGGLVAAAHGAGLAVHPYTLRADRLPPGMDSFESLLRRVFLEEGADGAFTDFPDRVVAFLDRAGRWTSRG